MLVDRLKVEYGDGYVKRDLAYYCQFYLTFREWEFLHELVQNLEWSHVLRVLSVTNTDARQWYLVNVSSNMWSG